MPSKEAIAINEMFKSFLGGESKGYLAEREEGRNRPKRPLPEGMSLKELTLGGNYAELVEKPGNDGPLVFYIHGGGFKTGTAQERREITFEIALKYGSNVIANNYRLCPENKWPIPLMDCVAAYEDILKMGYSPENIVFGGESAGAALVIGLLLYLRDNKMPLPKGAFVYSGSIIHDGHLPSHTSNIPTDYMLGGGVADDGDMEEIFGTSPEALELSKSPYISPIHADFSDLPPIFIAVSDAEALYDDSMVLYDKLKEASVKTELLVGNDLIHAYPIFVELPESVEALEKTFNFIKNI